KLPLGVCRKYHARRQIFAWLRVVTSIAPQCVVHGRDSFQRGLEVDFFWQGRKAAKFTSFLPSGGCRNPTIAEKLQEVGGSAHEFPFGPDIGQAAQAEASKSSSLLDLSEDWLDDRLPHLVSGSTSLGAQFAGHRLLGRGIFRWRASDWLDYFSVLEAPRGDMQIDTRYTFIGHIRLAEVARVGADLLRFLFQIRHDLRDHGDQLHLVVGLLRNLGGHDHLRRGIDRDLRVIALHKAAFVGSIRHDAALRIGEVALSRAVRLSLLRIGNPGLAPALLLACLLLLVAPRGQLGFGLGALPLGPLPRFLFQLRLGLLNLLQPALAPRQLLRQLVATLALAI